MRSSTATGWTVREQRGGVRLEMRRQGEPSVSVLLPFAWSKQEVGAILARVRNLYLLTLRGHGLPEAERIASGKAENQERQWSQALESFKQQKLEHGAAIKASTWEKTYAPVLTMALVRRQ